jgi:hypothetical protein
MLGLNPFLSAFAYLIERPDARSQKNGLPRFLPSV